MEIKRQLDSLWFWNIYNFFLNLVISKLGFKGALRPSSISIVNIFPRVYILKQDQKKIVDFQI